MKIKKKIVVFGPADSPHLWKWAEPMCDHYDITVVTFHHNDRIKADVLKKINYVALPRWTGTKLDYILLIPKIRLIFARLNPDLIHAHYLSSYGLVLMLSGFHGVKLLTIWGSDLLLNENKPIYRTLFSKYLKRFNWINAPSEFIRQNIAKNVDLNKVEVFQYGIDVNEFEVFKKKKTSIDDEIIFISTRTWEPLYNIEIIFEAFTIAYAQNQKLRLIVTGGGDAEIERKLREIAKKCEGIKILGFVTRRELIEQFWGAHVLVSIPSSDGMPLSVLEGIYCGCYPILSNLPANLEIVSHCPGTIVGSSVGELVKAIQETAERVHEFKPEQGVKFILEYGNYDINIQRLVSIYEKMFEVSS